jgi:hypothetical protein
VSLTSSVTVTGLGVFGNSPTSGLHSIMALYSNVNGAPSALIASTGSTSIGAGNNVLPVSPPVLVPEGSYWIAAEYSAAASDCTDAATTNVIALTFTSFGTLPSPFGAPETVDSVDLNYYVVGAE